MGGRQRSLYRQCMQIIPKKSLGQNFLREDIAGDIIASILDALQVKPDDLIIEIGPGLGILTLALMRVNARIFAIEKDHELVRLLSSKVSHNKVTIIEGDALKEPLPEECLSRPYKVAGNIPYNITGALLKRFLSIKPKPKILVFMIQKEVADRIIAVDGRESILSLSVKFFGEPCIIRNVSRETFTPQPNVDSAILKVSLNDRSLSDKFERTFFQLIRCGFSSPRKQLKNNLRSTLGEKTPILLEKIGVTPLARAESLPLSQWLELTKLTLANNQ